MEAEAVERNKTERKIDLVLDRDFLVMSVAVREQPCETLSIECADRW